MRDLKKEQDTLQQRFRLHLRRLHRDFTDKEIALMMGMTVDQANLVMKMRNGSAKIQDCDMIRLSQNLIDEYDDDSLLQELVPEGWKAFVVKSGETNGCTNDERLRLTGIIGELHIELSSASPDELKIVQLFTKANKEFATIYEEVKK